MLKAVVYARYSSDNQREESIEEQLYEINQWVQSNNCTIVATYTDEAETATTADNRDEFLQMVSDIQNGLKVDVLLLYKTDRFARNKWDAAIYKKMIRDQGIRIVYVAQLMLSEDTPEGFLMEGIFETLDHYYSLNLGREVMRGMKDNARKCKHTGGRPPLGFDVDKTIPPGSEKPILTYLINEREAQAVRIVFDMYDKGFSYDAIIRALNEQGYKTKTGGSFGKNSIHDILHNEKYVGVYVFNRAVHKIKGKRNNRVSKSPDQIIRVPGGMPQIIDQEVWDRVQARIKGRKQEPGKRARNKAITEYLLTGKIECAACGGKMVGKNGGKFGDKYGNKVRYDYYICNTRERKHECAAKMVRRDIIEYQVMEELERRVLNPGNFVPLAKEITSGLNSAGSEFEKELVYLQAELAKVQAKIHNILDLIEEGNGSDELKRRLSQRETEKQILLNRLDYASKKVAAKTITEEMVIELLQKQYEDLKAKHDSLTSKALIEQFVAKVIIYEKDFEVIFKILHTTGGGGAFQFACRNNIMPAKSLSLGKTHFFS